MTSKTGPGKAYREGLSLMHVMDMFATEDAAREWFETQRWPHGTECPRCDGDNVATVTSGKPMPWHCRSCRKYFSVRTDTVMAESKLPLRIWAIAIYVFATNLKGFSSMHLHRELGITQKSAWFLAHRLRQVWEDTQPDRFDGPVEVDETLIGGKEENKPLSKRTPSGRGGRGPTAGKAIVVGIRDRGTGQIRATPIERADSATLQGFVRENVEEGADVFTDEARAYIGLRDAYYHQSVKHSVGEYVDGQAHTNGIESFWAMLKRGYHGTYHQMSPEHLHRYVAEFAGRRRWREYGTLRQMERMARGLVGKRLTYEALTS